MKVKKIVSTIAFSFQQSVIRSQLSVFIRLFSILCFSASPRRGPPPQIDGREAFFRNPQSSSLPTAR